MSSVLRSPLVRAVSWGRRGRGEERVEGVSGELEKSLGMLTTQTSRFFIKQEDLDKEEGELTLSPAPAPPSSSSSTAPAPSLRLHSADQIPQILQGVHVVDATAGFGVDTAKLATVGEENI